MLCSIDAEEEDRYENLTKKQMIDAICQAYDTSMQARIDQVMEQVNEQIKPNSERLESLQKVILKVVAGLGVNEARQQFKDFDQHKESIGAIMQENPGMNYKDAYLLAKARQASETPPRQEVETEKPSEFASVPSTLPAGGMPPADFAAHTMRGRTGGAQQGQDSPVSGRVAFRNMVNQALDRQLVDRQE
jgi:hypothetical protein